MRIISGIRRGSKLIEFDGGDIRPTTDRVREAIFNLIQSSVPDASVLDMFAGSGALSLEALSRGAKSAVCIDRDRRAADIIARNAENLRFTDRCEIVNSSCFDYMERAGKSFDIIFLDPPYNKGFIEPVLKGIVKNGLLNDSGIVVLESDNTDYRGEPNGLGTIKQRRYGRTYITVYSRETNENSGLPGQL